MVFNATFNNISLISWRSILLVEETGVPGENQLYKIQKLLIIINNNLKVIIQIFWIIIKSWTIAKLLQFSDILGFPRNALLLLYCPDMLIKRLFLKCE